MCDKAIKWLVSANYAPLGQDRTDRPGQTKTGQTRTGQTEKIGQDRTGFFLKKYE